jgi:recombination protein RecA
MARPALERSDITSALRLATAVPAPPARWELGALSGRLAELSSDGAAAPLTLAFGLVLDAQRRGEPTAWITGMESAFFPPDAAEGGVDLLALAVVRVPALRQALRAAEHLARSGAFGLLVLDLGGEARVPSAALTRLAGLAARHETLVLFLTRKKGAHPSLGSLISLRGTATREPRGNGRFSCRVHALKDKRRGPGWSHAELCRGPAGLR